MGCEVGLVEAEVDEGAEADLEASDCVENLPEIYLWMKDRRVSGGREESVSWNPGESDLDSGILVRLVQTCRASGSRGCFLVSSTAAGWAHA